MYEEMHLVANLIISYFSNSSREVSNKKLAEVMQAVELTGLRYEETEI